MKYSIETPVALTVVARSMNAAVEAADGILPEGRRVLASAPSSASEPCIEPLPSAVGGPVTDVLLWAPDLTTAPAFARMVGSLPAEWRGSGVRRTVLKVGDLSFTGLLRGGRGDPVYNSAVRLGGDVAIVHDGLVRIERATGGAPEVGTRRLRHGSSEAVPDHEWSDAVAIGVDRAVTGLLRAYPSLLETPLYPDEGASTRYESIASLVGAPVALVAPVLDRVRALAGTARGSSTGRGDVLRAAEDRCRSVADRARAVAGAVEAASENIPAQALREAHRADAVVPARDSRGPSQPAVQGPAVQGPALPMSYRRLRQQTKGVGPVRRSVLEYANLTAIRAVADGAGLDEVEASTPWPAPDAVLDAAQEAELKELKGWLREWRRTAVGTALEARLKARDAVRWAPAVTSAARDGVSE